MRTIERFARCFLPCAQKALTGRVIPLPISLPARPILRPWRRTSRSGCPIMRSNRMDETLAQLRAATEKAA